ncbi:MAG: hypothetical protein IKF36_01450 [Bacilli bacterium]|nr:hypothetical protein [Bacilli bacterium]
MSKMYTADFETNVSEEDCRVWAYAICEIGNPDNFIYGNSIEDFIKWCFNDKKENYSLYFHNLKFDGEYIFSYLLNNGYEYIKNKKDRRDKTFTCLISDTGQFYSIEIYEEVKGKHSNKVTIYDSLKILNFSVEQIAKDFSLPIRKLDLDYKTIREVGHELTPHEIDYIRNDVEIMARALHIMFTQGLTKMTIGSDALSSYKGMLKSFSMYFPILPYEIDQDIRRSYKGGFTWLNPLYKEKDVKEDIIVVDSNSMHPSHMLNDFMPIGNPVYFEGEYIEDTCFPLYIVTLTCSFKLKKGKIPCIQLKNTLGFLPNEYVETTDGELVTLTLTSVDVKLFFMQYDVDNIYWHGGYKFRRLKGLFSNYINYWTNEKVQAKKDKNTALYRIAKLMLNSLYGKFGLNPNVRGKYPTLDEEGIVRYKLGEKEIRDSVYCPVASFITAYSRYDIITNSQAIRDYTLKKYGRDYYIYSDTDSIHCLKLSDEELSHIMEIDDYKLGAYKKESEAVRGIYIRQKCYVEEAPDGTLNTTIAGLPKKLGKYVNMNTFKKGFSVLAEETDKDHKLTFKHVKGGVLLVDTDFTIK